MVNKTITEVFGQLVLSGEDKIKESVTFNNFKIISYFDQRCLNLYCKDAGYRKIVNSGKIRFYAAGYGTRIALQFLLKKKIDKFNGTDLNTRIFEEYKKKSKRIFLIGGDFNKEMILKKSKKDGLNIVGYQNGYFSDEAFGIILKEIENKEPEVIVIGMGVPKQENMALTINDNGRTRIILCVGNFLEFYFGTVKRAPKYLRDSGFEWLYRLITEPKRLWKRYLIGIPLFFLTIIKEKLRLKCY